MAPSQFLKHKSRKIANRIQDLQHTAWRWEEEALAVEDRLRRQVEACTQVALTRLRRSGFSAARWNSPVHSVVEAIKGTPLVGDTATQLPKQPFGYQNKGAHDEE